MYAEWNRKHGSTQMKRKKKSQQSSIWLIGVIMDAVASTYQSEARGSEGEI